MSVRMSWGFPGSPVVRNPHFQCRGHRFNPRTGNKVPTCQKKWMFHHWQAGIIHTGNRVRNNALNYLHIVTQRRYQFIQSPPKTSNVLNICLTKLSLCYPPAVNNTESISLTRQTHCQKELQFFVAQVTVNSKHRCFNKEVITYTIF